ncbi:MAG: HPP family protein [Pseudomonadota bacterium]|nr:HPP family protein [Pseudomonadota bacterium]
MNLLQATWLQNLLPPTTSISQRERFRAGLGALLGILLTGMASALFADSAVTALWLMAPMGASAVLLFGAPASPLAQPWSIVGGNLLAAMIGVTCAKLIAMPVAAAAVAIFFSVVTMFALRCLHPPSGAVALTAVLGGAEVHAAGFGFVVAPVALNTALLLAVAVIYNSATGRRYPHGQQADAPHPHETADGPPAGRLGFTPGDLQAALTDYDQVLDISLDDLEGLFHRTEMNAFRRRFGDTRCAAVMSRDIRTVEFGTELADAWALMQTHAVQALPVVNRARHVIGIVTRSDFLRHAELHDQRSIGIRLRAFLQRTAHTHSDKQEVVGQIMSARVSTALDTTPVVELVPMMANVGHHHVPVVDVERKLVGMVTQTDLVAALYAICLARLAPARPLAA